MAKESKMMTHKYVRSAFGLLAAGVLTASLMNPVCAFADEEETESTKITAAQSSEVTFSTDYPGVTMKPGDTSTFTLYITNTGSQETSVSLSAEDLPDGWEGTFKGSSNEVSMVHVGAMQTKDDSPSLSYSLTIPEDTKEDTYTITLNAQGGDVDEDLALTVKVDAEEKVVGSGDFSTDYAEQEGTSGTKFSYTTTLSNNSGENQTYSLTAAGAPEGWNVTFTPSDAGSATSSVPVDAGASTTITVAVTPAQNVTAGEYPITLTAASAEEKLELPVTVKITGSYGLECTTPTGNLSAKAFAGETRDVSLILQNTGNIDLSNPTTLNNALALATSYANLKQNKDNADYRKAFTAGLIASSAGLITSANATAFVDRLLATSGLSNINSQNIAQTASTAIAIANLLKVVNQ